MLVDWVEGRMMLLRRGGFVMLRSRRVEAQRVFGIIFGARS